MMCLLLVAACSDDDAASVTGKSGYIQLRLFPKEAANTRSGGLDYMADAKKIELSLLYGDLPVTQSLNLSAVPNAAEFGLISEKLELLTGEYKLLSYTLYSDVKPGAEQPEKLLVGYPDQAMLFSINDGHITEVELSVKAAIRGNVYFELLKDLSNYQDAADEANKPNSRAIPLPEDEFNYDDIVEVDLYYHKKGTSERPTPHSFKAYRKAGEKYFHTDTAHWEAGEYEISRYMLYRDKKRTEMLLAGDLKDTYVQVEPNVFTKSDVKVTYPKDMKSIKDYVALYNIWIGLDGPNWDYQGQSFPLGSNWRFSDRPVDEWGKQPGVTLTVSGRVKGLDLGNFNPVGEIPAALGDLAELEGLWLGTHTDVNAVEETTYRLNTYELYHSGVDLRSKRMEIAKERMRLLHPIASSNIYEREKKKFSYAKRATYDFEQGVIANRITRIPDEIGKLTKLTFLFVANGLVSELPATLADLEELTDVEFYNCRFTKFPEVLCKLQKPVSINFSANAMIPADELTQGLNEFFRSQGVMKNLQLFYLVSCGLKDFPANMQYASRISLIDMANNKITSLPDMQRRIAPVQAIFDNNRITSVGDTFCNTDDVETFSVANNLITEFPNLFGNGTGSSNKYVTETIDFSYNKITHFKEGFLGLRANTLTLSGNKFGDRKGGTIKGKRTFPDDLSRTNSKLEFLQIANCDLDSLPPSCFKNLKGLLALNASGNFLKYIPSEFNVESLPYLNGLDLSINSFARFPVEVLYVQSLNKLFLNDQLEVIRNAGGQVIKEVRCLQKFPQNVESHFALRMLNVSGNDIRKISELDFPTQLAELNVSDNPNLEMTIPSLICSYIAAGMFRLGFDSNQYILGCPILDLDSNK